MKPSGAHAASLMHTLRTRRRLPLLLLLVLVIQALAPAVLAGTARAAEPLTTVLCTAEGVRHVVVIDAGAPAPGVPQHANCPYCGAHWQPPLIASTDPHALAPPALDAAPPCVAPVPVARQHVVAAHRSRAPPAPR